MHKSRKTYTSNVDCKNKTSDKNTWQTCNVITLIISIQQFHFSPSCLIWIFFINGPLVENMPILATLIAAYLDFQRQISTNSGIYCAFAVDP